MRFWNGLMPGRSGTASPSAAARSTVLRLTTALPACRESVTTMIRTANVGKRGLLQALAPSLLMLAAFSGAAAWEEFPSGDLATKTATLDIEKGRRTRFVFKSSAGEAVCPVSFCFRQGLEQRAGQTFIIEHDARGLLFSISDEQRTIVSREAIRKEFRKDLAWMTVWLLVFAFCLFRLLQSRQSSDE